jgi:hypothetical protein
MVQNLKKEDNQDPVETDKKGSNPHCKPLETDMKETEKNLEANSYKFARPRVYVQNNYESAEISAVDHLKYKYRSKKQNPSLQSFPGPTVTAFQTKE